MSRIKLFFVLFFTIFLFTTCEDKTDVIDPVVDMLTIEHFQISFHDYDSFRFGITTNKEARVYIGIVTQGASALTSQTIKTTPLKLNINVAEDQITEAEISGLMVGQAYDIYAMAEDGTGKQSSISKISQSTLEIPGFTVSKRNETPVSFILNVSSQAETRLTYVIQLATATELTAATIADAQGAESIDLEINTGQSILFTNLRPDTQYKLFYLLETRDGVDLIFQNVTHNTPAPVFQIRTENLTTTSFDVILNSGEHGSLTYLLQPSFEPAVDETTIAMAQNVQTAGVAANTDRELEFTNLTASTNYTLYYLLETLEDNFLLFGTLNISTPAPAFRILASHPAIGSTGFEVFDTIRITFDRDVEILNSGSIILRSVNGVQNDIRITLGDITVDGAEIEFDRNNYFRRTSNLPPLNMHFEQEYVVMINDAVREVGTNTIFNGEAIRFTTQSHPTYFHTVRADNVFTGPLNWSTLSNYHLQQLNGSKVTHSYSRATSENLTGDNVKVMIWDTGIYPGSEVFNAVVYQKLSLADDFIGDAGITFYNHGTQMGRYALNYASDINIYDVYKSAYPESTNPTIAATPDLQIAIDEDIDVVCLAGSGIGNRDDLVAQAISGGTIIATSLGNTSPLLNDTTNYTHKEKFVPYYRDLGSSSGAFVCLQAILDNGGGNYISIRSNAGHAKHYTLCIQETGTGATSQATSTFSGIMALMLEANRVNNTNYTPRQLVEILIDTAVDIGAPGVDNIYGHGYINIDAAITKLKTGTAPSHTLYQNLDSGVSEFFE